MSEHWKSTPKYWCKHCSTYVKDTPFEKKQHEATGKHQGNLRRFLNGIQKDHAKNEREKSQAKAEVERLNRVAGVAPSATNLDTGVRTSQTIPKATKSSSTTLSAADQKRQWAQLTEMGIPVPGDAGSDNAAPGGWQTVSRKVLDEPAQDIDNKLNIGVRKRKFEGQEEGEEASDTVSRRGWGASTRTYPGSTTASDDLDSFLATTIFKKKSMKESTKEDIKEAVISTKDSDRITEEAGHEGKIDIPLLGQASSGAPDSNVSQALKNEDVLPVTHNSELGEPTPIFKKRKPKHNVSSMAT